MDEFGFCIFAEYQCYCLRVGVVGFAQRRERKAEDFPILQFLPFFICLCCKSTNLGPLLSNNDNKFMFFFITGHIFVANSPSSYSYHLFFLFYIFKKSSHLFFIRLFYIINNHLTFFSFLFSIFYFQNNNLTLASLAFSWAADFTNLAASVP